MRIADRRSRCAADGMVRRCARRVVLYVALGMVGTVGVGCQQQGNVHGKVIQGNVGFIGEVEGKDSRFAGPGLEGVRVTARSAEGPRRGREVGSGVTNAKGEFSLAVADQNAALYPIEFVASKEGFGDARQSMPMPPSGRRLLIILRPRDGVAGASGGGGGS
jgi:hypothetical protein